MNHSRTMVEGTGAVLVPTKRHFVYKSRRHGGVYVNKDLVYTHPHVLAQLGKSIASEVGHMGVEVVVGPAIGGALLAQAVGYAIVEENGPALCTYAEKEVVILEKDPEGLGRKLSYETGRFVLRRGYDEITRGRRVVVVEDIITTGGSVRGVIAAVRELDCEVLAVRAIWNRGGVLAKVIGVDDFGSLITDTFPDYAAESCPFCKEGIEIDTKIGHGAAFVAEHGQPQKQQ